MKVMPKRPFITTQWLEPKWLNMMMMSSRQGGWGGGAEAPPPNGRQPRKPGGTPGVDGPQQPEHRQGPMLPPPPAAHSGPRSDMGLECPKQSEPPQGPRVAGGGRGDRWVKFRLGPPARGSAQTKSPTRPPDPPSRHPFPFPTNPPAPQVGAHCLGGDTVPALPHTRWGASAPHLGRGGFRPLYPPPAANDGDGCHGHE